MVEHLVIGYSCRIKGHRHTTSEQATECIQKTAWLERFDERQQSEIALALLYAEQFGHGTDGHNAKMIIAQMAKILIEAAG